MDVDPWSEYFTAWRQDEERGLAASIDAIWKNFHPEYFVVWREDEERGLKVQVVDVRFDEDAWRKHVEKQYADAGRVDPDAEDETNKAVKYTTCRTPCPFL